LDKKLLEIINLRRGNDFDLFCDYISNCNYSIESIIQDILYDTSIQNKYSPLKKLAWYYFVELQGRNMGEDFHFEVSDFARSFQRYLYSWDRLGRKRVPFEEWSDLADEGIKLLKDLINENKLENYKNDPRYRDFMKRFIQRHEDLRLSGEYPDLNELMDD
jgi:hypothetical protein